MSVDMEKLKAKIPLSKETKKQLVNLLSIFWTTFTNQLFPGPFWKDVHDSWPAVDL